MFTRTHIQFCLFALAVSLAPLPAQMGGGDPSKEIKEIAEAIDRQLKEIDELLLESGRKGQARSTPKELLKKAAESSASVQDGIDKLIEKLNEMKNKGGGGGGGGQSSDQQGESKPGQQGQSQQGQSGQTRRENQTPDFVQQPKEGQQEGEQGKGKKPGEQEGKPGEGESSEQGQTQGDGQPKGGKQSQQGGENRLGNSPPNSETGPGKKGTGEAAWGNLQPYLNFLRNRGSSPKVPQKYRKYYEAYLKNKAKGKK